MQTMEIFQKLPWTVDVSIKLVGMVEIATGALLITGFLSRWAAALVALQLIAILCLLHFQELRDIGLLGTAFYLAGSREQCFGLDWYISRRRLKEN